MLLESPLVAKLSLQGLGRNGRRLPAHEELRALREARRLRDAEGVILKKGMWSSCRGDTSGADQQGNGLAHAAGPRIIEFHKILGASSKARSAASNSGKNVAPGGMRSQRSHRGLAQALSHSS